MKVQPISHTIARIKVMDVLTLSHEPYNCLLYVSNTYSALGANSSKAPGR